MARVKRRNPYEPAVRAVIEDLKEQLASAQVGLAERSAELDAAKAALKATEEKARKDRMEAVDSYAKNLEVVRGEERDRRKSAYETMTLYAAQLRSGLMLLRSNSTWEPDAETEKKFNGAVKSLRDARPPKEVSEALDVVLKMLDEALVRVGRTEAIVGTMIDAEFPKVEQDSVDGKWLSVLGGVGMATLGVYALFAGFGGKKAGAGWGGP